MKFQKRCHKIVIVIIILINEFTLRKLLGINGRDWLVKILRSDPFLFFLNTVDN